MAQGMKMEMGVGVFVLMMSMMCGGTAAQSSCTSVLMNLSPCLNYISGNSSTPSSGCCSQLASVVRSQPQCLCEVLNGGGSSLGITINQTRALALPAACNVHTPSISNCGSPAESPNSGPPGTGSANGPTTENGSYGANSVKLSIPLLLFVLAATYAPTFVTLIL